MAEEVRIVASLDTTDITNGVQRSAAAAREMKQVWETTTWLGPVGGGGAGGGGGMMGKLWPDPEGDGAQAGTDFTKGFLGRLLIRDAISTLIRGISQVISETMDNLETLSGDKGPHKGLMARITGSFSDGFTQAIASIPALANAYKGLGESFVGSTNADILRDRQLRGYREHPETLTTSLSTLQGGLEGTQERADQARRENAQSHLMSQELADPEIAKKADQVLSEQLKQLGKEEQYYKELIALAKERDKTSDEAAKKSMEADERARDSILKADDFMRGEIRKDEADKARKEKEEADKASRHAAAVKKNHEEHADAAKISADEAEKNRSEKDLRFTEGELKKQHATSAVMINGQLFGRNDTAGALVAHAQQQVTLLRSIDSEIKQLRKSRSDLTLL